MKKETYILQKDIFNAKAGTEFTKNSPGIYLYTNCRGKWSFLSSIDVEDNIEWFVKKD